MITKRFEEQIRDSYENAVVEIGDSTPDYHKPDRRDKGTARNYCD